MPLLCRLVHIQEDEDPNLCEIAVRMPGMHCKPRRKRLYRQCKGKAVAFLRWGFGDEAWFYVRCCALHANRDLKLKYRVHEITREEYEAGQAKEKEAKYE